MTDAPMLTLPEIVERLADHRAEVVAAETGLSYQTVRKYAEGRAKQPAHETVVLLSKFLAETEPA